MLHLSAPVACAPRRSSSSEGTWVDGSMSRVTPIVVRGYGSTVAHRSVPLALLLALLACHSASLEEAPSSWGSFTDLEPRGASGSRALHLTPDEVALTEPHWKTMGIDPASLAEWQLTATPHAARTPNDHGLHTYAVDFPVPLTHQEKKFKPLGMNVRVDGHNLPFSRSGGKALKHGHWRIQGDRLLVHHGEAAESLPVVVDYPAVADRLLERQPPADPARHAEHAHMSLTFGGITRDGLMLPSGSSASWDVTVPQDAPRWVSVVALEPSRLPGRASDGASIKLIAEPKDQPSEVLGERSLKADVASFEPWQVDLSAYAGQTVTLKVETGPGADADPLFDWVFLGAPAIHGAHEAQPRRVVVIGIDTLRRDKVIGDNQVVPDGGFASFAQSAARFEQAWTPAPRTRPSFRSATTGRLPLEAVGAENIGHVFQRNGWATAGIVANIHLQPRFGFHEGFDYWHFAGDRDAKVQIDEALEWLGDQGDRDTFLFLHFMDPHLPYHAPKPFLNRYVTDPDPDIPDRFNRGTVLDWQRKDQLTDQRKTHIEGRHDGEVAYLDRELGRLVTELDALPGDTLVVVHNDHGEEFWDHGGFEHNHTLHEELVNAVLWFRPKGGLSEARSFQTPATLADIGPTLYALTGVTDPPPTDGLDLSPWLLDPATPQGWTRPLPLGYLQYGHDRWGVLWEGYKYILHTGSGKEELYHLETDPLESKNLVGTKDTASFFEQLAKAHQIPAPAAGPGLRIRVQADRPGWELRASLPEPCDQAGVLDPEVVVERRANLEWGESPKKLMADVGHVELNEAGTEVLLQPGSKPGGILWVRCASMPDVSQVTLSLDGQPLPAPIQRQKSRVWRTDGPDFTVHAGWVLVPPPSEHARMTRGMDPEASPDEDEIDLLKSLGYIGHTEEDH